MKEEKELKWIICLYNSPYIKDIPDLKFLYKTACKKDFERLLDVPEKSKEFTEWFNELKDIGVFVSVGKKTRGSRNNVVAVEYFINVTKLVGYAKKNNLYTKAFRFFNRGRIL